MTDIDLIKYYTDLIILQYTGQPKAQATVQAIAQTLTIYEIIRAVENAYDVDTALGPQLDILGKYVGVSRTVIGTVFTRTYFGYTLYGTSPPYAGISGYSVYGVTPPDVQFRTYQESNQSIYTLTDNELRTVLKIKIVLNYFQSSLKDADDNLPNYFNGRAIITDLMDMRVSYIFEDSVKRLVSIAISEGLLIRPTGVSILISYAYNVDAIFGYKKYGETPPSYFRGYKKYGVANPGSWSRYV